MTRPQGRPHEMEAHLHESSVPPVLERKESWSLPLHCPAEHSPVECSNEGFYLAPVQTKRGLLGWAERGRLKLHPSPVSKGHFPGQLTSRGPSPSQGSAHLGAASPLPGTSRPARSLALGSWSLPDSQPPWFESGCLHQHEVKSEHKSGSFCALRHSSHIHRNTGYRVTHTPWLSLAPCS